MASISSPSLPVVFQTIRQAQELDAKGNEAEAHKHYLAAVQQIAFIIQTNCGPHSCLTSDRISQLYGMSKQCLEQAESLFTKATEEKRSLKESRPPLISAQSFPSHSSQPQSCTTTTKTTSPQFRPARAPSAPQAYSVPKEPSRAGHASYNSRVSRLHPQPNNVHSLHKISPMEAARRKNIHLMAQYQTALKNNPTMSIPSSQNLSLNYLRRLEENLSIARQTEQTMARKLRQRELRLQEETAQRSRSRSVESLTELQLKEEVTYFEQGKSNIASLKQILYSENESTSAVVNLIHEVLNTTDHPLRRLFGECQYSIMQYLQPIIRDIEKAGDLPRLDIKQGPPHSPLPRSHSPLPRSHSSLPRSLSPSFRTKGSETNQSSQDPADCKLASLRAQLLEMDSPVVTKNSNDTHNVTKNSNDAKDVIIYSNDGEEDEDLSDFKTMASFDIKEEECFVSLKNKKEEEKEEEKGEEEGEEETKEEEEEEEVHFPALPRLVCTTIYGNTDILQSLSTKYENLLSGATKMIHDALDKLVSSFVLSYQPIGSEENIDICRAALESLFFPAILPLMSTLYRCINYTKECTVASNMSKYVNASPKDLSVRRPYWLENQDTPPYAPAIEKLKSLPTLHSPSPKLDCLVSLSKCIVQCIEDYHDHLSDGKKDDTVVGVDDLLPIMTYVIIRSGLPQLVSECSLLQEFIQEGFLMGEEGFCLTTFDTAMKYIIVMTS